MGQVLHGSATTTEAVRRAIQHSQESLRAARQALRDQPEDRRQVEEAHARSPICRPARRSRNRRCYRSRTRRSSSPFAGIRCCRWTIAFMPCSRRIPHLTRSSLHRCLQRHGISPPARGRGRQAGQEEVQEPTRSATSTSIIAEVQTAEGKLYLYVAIDRTSKFAFVQFVREDRRGPRRRPSWRP